MFQGIGVHAFGSKAPTKENQDARSARLLQGEQSAIDARALRLRRKLIARGREASSLFGGGEADSLGAGL